MQVKSETLSLVLELLQHGISANVAEDLLSRYSNAELANLLELHNDAAGSDASVLLKVIVDRLRSN